MLLNTNILTVILMIFLLVIFTVLLIHKGRNKYSNIMLAIYFVSQIIGIFDALIVFSRYLMHFGIIFYPVIFTWGPCFYLYIVSLLNSEFRFRLKHTVHFIPFLVVLIYTALQFYFKETDIRITMLTSFSILQKLYSHFGLLFNIQIVSYNIAAFVGYLIYQKNAKNQYSQVDQNSNRWLKTSLFGFLIACFITQIGIHSHQLRFLSYLDWWFISDLSFLIFFVVLFYKAIISPNFFVKLETKEKYRYSNLDQVQAIKLLNELENYMVERKPFSDSSLSLKNLALLTGISERNLSQIINEYKKQNFFDFVNSYRVKYAMELLRNPENEQRIMLDILFESGFNSKTTFNITFKKHTGITPSDYKKKFSSMLKIAS
jgi:AraC-like DNA-binding protein